MLPNISNTKDEEDSLILPSTKKKQRPQTVFLLSRCHESTRTRNRKTPNMVGASNRLRFGGKEFLGKIFVATLQLSEIELTFSGCNDLK